MSRDFSIHGPHPERGQCILNYVWLDSNERASGEDVCRVPLHGLDRAIMNARRYPTVDVRFWIDRSTLNDYTRDLLNKHLETAPSNFKEHDLKDVAAYMDRQQYPIFGQYGHGTIWPRVDLLRLLVLEHCFETSDANDIFYSDFDIKNTNMTYWRLTRSLERHGMAFSKAGKLGDMENGLIGFRRGHEGFLKNVLIPHTSEAAKAGENGHKILLKSMRRWGKGMGVPFALTRLSVCEQRGRGYKTPGIKVYENQGVRFEKHPPTYGTPALMWHPY